ncbi:MAG: S41 family peptidase [Planctomycetota bacterium]
MLILLSWCLAVIAADDPQAAADRASRARVIDEIAATLNSDYVFPEVATRMAAALRDALHAGRYDRATAASELAALLTRDLQAISHDGHLRVDAMPASPLAADARDDATARTMAAWNNHGFVRVERLPGNVGYVKLDSFAAGDDAELTASNAMSFLADTSALIFDLRDNGGGSPDMIVWLASYLLDEPVHLNSFFNRRTGATTETWSRAEVPGRRYDAEKPVYVLTSKRTFSAAEEFTYDLKNLERAVVVGETTGGGAHPVFPHRLNAEMVMSVPFARAINPITNTNWEGTGVLPDIAVKASDALYAAELDALAQIDKSVSQPLQKADVQDALRQVKAKYPKY